MNNYSILQLNSWGRSSSMGVKLILVCGLALLMIIPALFVDWLVQDRTQRAEDVVNEISTRAGGPQTFLGPTLAIPYSVPSQLPTSSAVHGIYLVFPTQASVVLRTTTEERHRSLFRVPVFQADLKLDGDFDLSGVPAIAPKGAELDWSQAEIILGVSDLRGALADAILTTNGKTMTLAPVDVIGGSSLGADQQQPLKLSLLGARADDLARPDARFHVTSELKFSGAKRVAVLAYGKTTRLTAQGDWKNPGFDGGILPVSRTITNHGFTADWSVPFIARGVAAEGPDDLVSALNSTSLGVSFIELADPYQSVNRSLKYAPLFLGLVFLSYFVFEATTGKRVHPAQYILVGIAQLIFYLLLLSFAERIGFDSGFLLAGIATVGLLSANAGWIFSSRLQGVRALVIFGSLYALIYLLLTLEDNALMVGAIASFLAVAAAMHFTRSIDWYGSASASHPPDEPSAR